MKSVLKLSTGLIIVTLLITAAVLTISNGASVMGGEMEDYVQTETPTIADTLMIELSEMQLESGVRVIGISYYDDIDAVVIGLEKKTYSDNEHLRNSMIGSIYEIMPTILTHSNELNGKKIVFTGSSISLNAKGSRTMMKIFHTEVGFDVANQISWNESSDIEKKEQIIADYFEYVWWHSAVKDD